MNEKRCRYIVGSVSINILVFQEKSKHFKRITKGTRFNNIQCMHAYIIDYVSINIVRYQVKAKAFKNRTKGKVV